MKVLSVDAETNGLHGRPFCIGAICTTGDSNTADVYLARCPIDGPVDPWVAANVFPAIADIGESFVLPGGSYAAMLADFAAWFDAHKDGAEVIAHVGVPVEARLFADMAAVLGRDPFSGPFPLHDVATRLHDMRWDPLSADSYAHTHELELGDPFDVMSPHNPLYDARVAERVWRHAGAAFGVPAEPIPAAEGKRITEAADMHPKRDLVWALAQATHDLDGEAGNGGGMWWHLDRALAVVDMVPGLTAGQP